MGLVKSALWKPHLYLQSYLVYVLVCVCVCVCVCVSRTNNARACTHHAAHDCRLARTRRFGNRNCTCSCICNFAILTLCRRGATRVWWHPRSMRVLRGFLGALLLVGQCFRSCCYYCLWEHSLECPSIGDLYIVYLTCIDITAASPKINDQQSGVNYAYVLSLLYSQ